ncbi:MAG: helix-turn-helix transcriptional regulator [Dehalococcoidia bacterium]
MTAHSWTFLSHHALVLLCIARDPDARLSEIAHDVGVTERAVQRLVGDLLAAGYISRIRVGRRNTYQVDASRLLRHPIEQPRSVSTLLTFLDVVQRPAECE